MNVLASRRGGRSGTAAVLTLCAAIFAPGCAGPVQILRESGDPAERIAAAEELRTEADEGRMEALADALNDADGGVRLATAKTLGVLGGPGRDLLIEALRVEKTACVAAPVLAKKAAKFPEIAKALDPTVGRRRSDSCVVKAFTGLGAATHEVLIEAMLSDETKRRKRAYYLACKVAPPVTDGIQTVLLGPEDGRVDNAESALSALLKRRHKNCGDKPEAVWNAVFADPSVRHRAITVVDDHPRRAELLEPLIQIEEACVGPDALLLAMDAGYGPTDKDLEAFSGALAAAGEERCPTVDPDAMIATLLTGGLTSGTFKQARGRLDMIQRLGWQPDTTRAKVYVAVIETEFMEAAGYGPAAAGPLLEAVVRWKMSKQQQAALYQGLAKVGPSVVPAIDEALQQRMPSQTRDGLLGVVQTVLGARSAEVVKMAVAELLRATDDQGIIAIPLERTGFLTGLIKAAGTSGSPALAEATLVGNKLSFRSLLFSLLVDVEGKKGRVLTKMVGDLLDSQRDDLLVAAAAGHLATGNSKVAKSRVVAAVRAGKLTPGDRKVLAFLLARDPKKIGKVLAKVLKGVSDATKLTEVAEALADVGMYTLALPLSSKASKKLLKLAGAAAASGDSKAGIRLQASASKMEAVREKSVRGLYDVAVDDTLGAKQRIKALKILLKGTKKVGLGGAGPEVVKGLKRAMAGEGNKKVKKTMKKAYKKLKKRL